jgi:Uma2 family endonuclease
MSAIARPAPPRRYLSPDEVDWSLYPETDGRDDLPEMNDDASELTLHIAGTLEGIPEHKVRIDLDMYGPEDDESTSDRARPDIVVYPAGRHVGPNTYPLSLWPPPDLIVEIVSPGNPENDHVRKVELYRRWKVPVYLIVDPLGSELRVVDAAHDRDEVLPADGSRVVLSPRLSVQWDGSPHGFRAWWDGEELLNRGRERAARLQAELGRRQAELGRRQAEIAQDKAEAERDRLASLLREHGIEP